jgi:stage V sporulation protein G
MLNITEVRVKLMHDRSDRLRAFCSITIDDDFVVHDLRVIEGRKGFFVAMPSRKLSDNCPKCGAKNDLRAAYCSSCGKKLDENRAGGPDVSHDKLHVDVAHPINTECREEIQGIVLEAYEDELAEHEETEPEEEHEEDLYEEHEEEEAEEYEEEPEDEFIEPEPEEDIFEPEEVPEAVPLGEAPEPFEPEEAEVGQATADVLHAEGVVEDFEPAEEPERGPEPAPAPEAVSAPEPGPSAGEDIVENFKPEPEPGQEEEPAPEPEDEGAPRRVRRSRTPREERKGGGFGEGIL